jgi:hypothetical protein
METAPLIDKQAWSLATSDAIARQLVLDQTSTLRTERRIAQKSHDDAT